MLNPAVTDLLPPPTSPTISSLSSSDFDSESTGSFFHDRSTTLGTLMGVAFPPITFHHSTASQHHRESIAALPGGGSRRRREMRTDVAEDYEDHEDGEGPLRRQRSWLRKRRRRRWWGICRDDVCREDGGDGRRKSSSASLAEFLEVERKFGETFYGGGEVEVVVPTRPGERVLFADGRVLPPGERDPGAHGDGGSAGVGGGFRFPGSLGGICNRGVG